MGLMLGGLLTAIDPDVTTQPPESPKPAVAAAKPAPAKPPEKRFRAEQFFTSQYLGDAFETNALKAEKDFNGVEIPVTGIVKSVTSTFGMPYVVLEAEKLLGVQCIFPRDMTDALAKLQKGQTVFVIGTCRGKTLEFVTLDNCRFVQPLE